MRFLKSIQQDAELFLYIYLLLMLFRIAFLAIYAGQMGSAGVGDILTALWLGARISLKTTAFLVAFPFLFATIPYAFYSKWPVAGIRKVLGSVEISLMTFLFMARIPYYEIFHQGFNIMLFNGMKDDKWAIFDTAVQQYALWPRLLGACVLGGFLCVAVVARSSEDECLESKEARSALGTRSGGLPSDFCNLLSLRRGVSHG